MLTFETLLGTNTYEGKNCMTLTDMTPLSVPATNCKGETSFSTLHRVKNYLRSSINHDRLTSLSLLTLDGGLTQEMPYDDFTFA